MERQIIYLVLLSGIIIPEPIHAINCGKYSAEFESNGDVKFDDKGSVTVAIGVKLSVTFNMSYDASDMKDPFIRIGMVGGRIPIKNCTGTNGSDGNVTYTSECYNLPSMAILHLTLSSSYPSTISISAWRFCQSRGADLASIVFSDCKNSSLLYIILEPMSSLAKYRESGTVACRKKSARPIYTNLTKATSTRCGMDAKWEDIANIECVHPVPVKLRINNETFRSRVVLQYTSDPQYVYLSCTANATDEKGIAKFKVGDVIKSGTIELTPSLNNNTVSCYYENNYTKVFNERPKEFTSYVSLGVQFGPYHPSNQSSLCLSQERTVFFYANPAMNESLLYFVVTGERGSNQTYYGSISRANNFEYGTEGQLITGSLDFSEYSTVYLETNISGRTKSYRLESCDNVMIPTTGFTGKTTTNAQDKTTTNSQDKTTDYKQQNISVFAGAGAGGFLFLILCGVLIRMIVKRQQVERGDNERMENLNPAYADAAGIAAAINGHQMVDNVVYGAMPPNDVYAVPHATGRRNNRNNPSDGLYAVVGANGPAPAAPAEENAHNVDDAEQGAVGGFDSEDQNKPVISVSNETEQYATVNKVPKQKASNRK